MKPSFTCVAARTYRTYTARLLIDSLSVCLSGILAGFNTYARLLSTLYCLHPSWWEYWGRMEDSFGFRYFHSELNPTVSRSELSNNRLTNRAQQGLSIPNRGGSVNLKEQYPSKEMVPFNFTRMSDHQVGRYFTSFIVNSRSTRIKFTATYGMRMASSLCHRRTPASHW
ncbi:hypothetical protein FRC03_008632 [Tulasnella sp. 419]|nr:hypothetical protein FRC03_008632 [Tulasnella sp. 419]